MRLMIVDDFRFIRRHVRTVLGSIPGAEVVAEASSGEEALAASERGEAWFSPSIRREQLEDVCD